MELAVACAFVCVFVDVPWRLTWSPLSFIACVAVSCVVVIGRPQACCAPSGGKRDNLLGAGEVAVKAVAIAAQSHTARSIDLFHSALRACVVNKGKWEWVAFTYRAMKEAGFVPVDATHELIVQVCVCVCAARRSSARLSWELLATLVMSLLLAGRRLCAGVQCCGHFHRQRERVLHTAKRRRASVCVFQRGERQERMIERVKTLISEPFQQCHYSAYPRFHNTFGSVCCTATSQQQKREPSPQAPH